MTTKDTMTLSPLTASITRDLILRDLECYKSNLLRKCYDNNITLKDIVNESIENLEFALAEIDSLT